MCILVILYMIRDYAHVSEDQKFSWMWTSLPVMLVVLLMAIAIDIGIAYVVLESTR